MKRNANEELKPSDIPSPEADEQSIVEFAHTFDGYAYWGSFEECARVANEERHGSLAELRTCLFFEYRRWRHMGCEPDEEDMDSVRSIVERIRTLVREAEGQGLRREAPVADGGAE